MKRFFQLGMRDLLLLIAIVAVALGWWVDRRRLTTRLNIQQLQLARRQPTLALRTVVQASPPEKPKSQSVEEFLAFLDPDVDWYEFQSEQSRFARSPLVSETIPALIDRLDDPDPQVRTRVISALGCWAQKPDLVVPALLPYLNDTDPGVSWFAAFSLSFFGGNAIAAKEPLLEKFDDDESPIATQAGLTLKKIDPRTEVAPRLLELVDNPHYANRFEAIAALRHHVSFEQMEGVLVRRFEVEQDERIRRMIANALSLPAPKSGVPGSSASASVPATP